MDLGWKWMIPASLINVVWTALAIFTVQALDGWNGMKTIESLARGLDLTGTGKTIMVAFGLVGLLITAALLSSFNWRSRDFNLKKHRRQVRLVNAPQGKPAVATIVSPTRGG